MTDEDGAVTAWRVETGALAVLRARGLLREFLYVGDDVQVYGDATYDGRSEVFAHNLLLSDGKEVMLTVGSSEHFSRGGAMPSCSSRSTTKRSLRPPEETRTVSFGSGAAIWTRGD